MGVVRLDAEAKNSSVKERMRESRRAEMRSEGGWSALGDQLKRFKGIVE